MYLLTPPSETFKTGSDALWGGISHTRPLALVVYTDGRVVTARVAPPASDPDVVFVWPGGRVYPATAAQAELLTEAGYATCLEVVA